MKRKRFTEEQIVAILKEHEAGVATAELCRKHGMSSASFYGWKAKYGLSDSCRPKLALGSCGSKPGLALSPVSNDPRLVVAQIAEETFSGADFQLQSDGVCRLNPELARRIAQLNSPLRQPPLSNAS
jgi:hypothetical protein